MSLRDVLLVAGGGAIGAVARHLVSVLCVENFGARFPWGTMIVNVIGCLALGWLLQTASSSTVISDAAKLAVGTGFLGAFTTFSTFGVQTIHTWQKSPMLAIVNVAGNVVLGLAAAMIGIYLASRKA